MARVTEPRRPAGPTFATFRGALTRSKRTAAAARFSVVASSKSRQEEAGGQPAATSAVRAAILPALCSVDYRHQHIDMVTTSYLRIWRMVLSRVAFW